jgi:hypothetical protein
LKYVREPEDHALADRLVNYSDAMVTLAFIISSGLGFAIADPDTLRTIAGAAVGIVIGNAFLGVLFSTLLVILRHWELELRADLVLSEKYKQYTGRINIARHVVIWLSITQTVAVLLSIRT